MNININKDFETEYKEDVGRGFTMRQMSTLIASVIVCFLQMAGIYYFFHLPIATCVYPSMPGTAVVLAIGFYDYQGLTLTKLVQELLYERQTRLLTFEAGECDLVPKQFTMGTASCPKAKHLRGLWKKLRRMVKGGVLDNGNHKCKFSICTKKAENRSI